MGSMLSNQNSLADNSSSSSSSSSSEWNPDVSITAALPESIGTAKFDLKQQKLMLVGPSKSLQILICMKGKGVLMAEDFDPRKSRTGGPRKTFGALKASFGHTLSVDDGEVIVWDIITDPSKPPNVDLYFQLQKCFDKINPLNFTYSERGEGWGPAVTVPVMMEYDENLAQTILNELNAASDEAVKEHGEESMKARYRNFRWVSLEALKDTGNDDAVLDDETKLVKLELDGKAYKLWDENQMRKAVIPHLLNDF